MFEQPSPSVKDRLSTIYQRYSHARVPATHLNTRTVLLTLLFCRNVQIGKKGQIKASNGVIDFDLYSDGKTFKYEVDYDQNGTSYKSHVIGQKLSDQTMKIDSIMLDNQSQPLKSPQEIFAALLYMDQYFSRGIRKESDSLRFKENKPYPLNTLGRQLARLQFAVKRGM